MSEAKITLQTILEDKGLQSLNTELAKGTQEVKQMKADLKELEKAGKGTSDAAVKLAADIKNMESANKSLSQAIKESTKELGNAGKETQGFAASLKGGLMDGLGTSEIGFGLLTGAAAGLAATLAGEVLSAIKDVAAAIVDLGAKQEQTVARLSQVQSIAAQGLSGSDAYALFDATARDLEISTEQATQFSIQLMNAGISAQNASAMIGLCSDASYALSGSADQMQGLVNTFVSIAQRGEITSRQLKTMQEQGMDLDKAFAGMGMNGADAMQAVEDGTMDAETAINTLIKYMDDEYGGATSRAKDNTLSAWADVEGNMSAIMGTIGGAIFDAFDKSGIVQSLIDITQSLLDLVQDDGESIFSAFGDVATAVLDAIGDALDIIVTTIKLVILVGKEMADAFRNIGSAIVSYLEPILSPLKEIWNVVSSLIRTLGKEIKGAVSISYSETFKGARSNVGGGYDESQNRIRTQGRKSSGTASKAAKSGGSSRAGGSGSKSRVEQISEEERAYNKLVEAMTKANEVQKIMDNNNGFTEAQAKKLLEMQDNLKIAEQFNNPELVSSIKKNIADLYGEVADANAKEREKAFAAQAQGATSAMWDSLFGDKDSLQEKIAQTKQAFQEVVQAKLEAEAAAGGSAISADSDEGKGLLDDFIRKSPEAFQADMEAKLQTMNLATMTVAEAMGQLSQSAISNADQGKSWAQKWASYFNDFADGVGTAVGEWVTGEKSFTSAMGDMVKDLLKNAAQLAAKWLTYFALFSLAGPATAAHNASVAVFGVGKYSEKGSFGLGGLATGGYVSGKGTSTSDSIPMMLSNGEYVINAAAVNAIGRSSLDAINAGRMPESIGDGTATIGGGSVSLNVSTMDAGSFSDWLTRTGGDAIRQYIYENNRNFATSAGLF